jgi:hypothetical protein
MDSKKLKIGMKVSISLNINSTTAKLGSNPAMQTMAGDGKQYEIQDITNHSDKRAVVRIKGYVWMPEDLIYTEGYLHPVSLKGKIVTFDPCDL